MITVQFIVKKKKKVCCADSRKASILCYNCLLGGHKPFLKYISQLPMIYLTGLSGGKCNIALNSENCTMGVLFHCFVILS